MGSQNKTLTIIGGIVGAAVGFIIYLNLIIVRFEISEILDFGFLIFSTLLGSLLGHAIQRTVRKWRLRRASALNTSTSSSSMLPFFIIGIVVILLIVGIILGSRLVAQWRSIFTEKLQVQGNLLTIDRSRQNLTTITPELIVVSKDKTQLNLSRNQITELPPDIAQLSNLQVLDISMNQLIALPPEIGKPPQLKALHVWMNKLNALPLEMAQLYNLDFLNISNNKFETFPLVITQLANL